MVIAADVGRVRARDVWRLRRAVLECGDKVVGGVGARDAGGVVGGVAVPAALVWLHPNSQPQHVHADWDGCDCGVFV